MTKRPWTGSTRRQRLPKNWPNIRTQILNRDNHQCQWLRADTGKKCGRPANQVDHITPGDNHHPTNLQALCKWHHERKSSHEGNTSPKRRVKSKMTHPGIID